MRRLLLRGAAALGRRRDGALLFTALLFTARLFTALPWVGGETALFDGVAAFASLPPRLRAALAQPATVRRHHSLRRLRTRHGEAIDARLGALAARDGAAVQLDGLDGGTVCLTLRRTACGGEGVSFNFGELSGCAAARPATLRRHERGSLLATFSAPSCRRGRLLNK